MKRFVALLAVALLAMAGTAVAKTHGTKHGGKHGAKVYRATLAPIDLGATAPSGDTAQADDPTTDPTDDPTADPTDDPTTDPTDDPTTDPTDDPTTDPTGDTTPTGGTSVSGKAHLVDGRKKNNILTIHAKGLTAGTTYEWHLHAFPVGLDNPCVAGAPVGALDTSFAYGKLTGNSAGNGSAKAKSRTFNWDPTNRYYVDIHDPLTDTPIACGVLASKAHKAPKTKTKAHGKKNGKKHGKGPVAKAPKAPKAPKGKK